MRYYTVLSTGEDAAGAWFLNDPVRATGSYVSPWIFTEGRRLHLRSRLIVTKYQEGRALPLSIGSSDIPFVDKKGHDLFETVASDDVQLIPIAVDGETALYWILNAVHSFDCIDEQASSFKPYSADEPNPTGRRYRIMYRLKIDPTRVAGHVLRIKDWEGPLVVSEVIRDAIVEARFPGLVFKGV